MTGCQRSILNPRSVRSSFAVLEHVAKRFVRPWLFVCAGSIATLSGLQFAGGEEPVSIVDAQPSVAPPGSSLRILPTPESVPIVPAETGLTLEQLEELAVMHNPSLVRASAQVGAARGNWVQVGLPANPVVGYSGQQVGSGGLAEQHGIAVNQEIIRGGKLKLNRAIAAQDVNRAQQESAAQLQRVRTDVRVAYYQVLAAQRQIDLTEELSRVGKQGLEAAEALFNAKQVGRADLLQAQLEIENANILLQNARNRHVAAWSSLTAVVGIPSLPQQALAGDLMSPPLEFELEQVIERLNTTSPEIAMAMSTIARARASYARARVEPRPNLYAQALVNVVDNGIGGRPDGAIGVAMPIPIFNRNQGAIVQAQHEITAAQQALEQLELDLRNRLAPTFERYANARNQVERYRTTILPVANESLELTRKSYGAGEIGFIGLLTVQRTYSQTNLNYLEALKELRTSEAEIDGLLLSGSLQNRR